MKVLIKYSSNDTEKSIEMDNFKSIYKYPNGTVEIKSIDENISGLENSFKIPEESLISISIE